MNLSSPGYLFMFQIPSLLKLKHLPSVIFAGIDSPEDVLSYTYQELFQTGGFVVSDDRILETLTLGLSLIFLSYLVKSISPCPVIQILFHQKEISINSICHRLLRA